MKTFPTPVEGALRRVTLKVPECIRDCSGILVFGKRIKSLVFTTDVSIIRNVNADAVIAVYPFTPQPIITHALMLAADIPVIVGVGLGGTADKACELAKESLLRPAGQPNDDPFYAEMEREIVDKVNASGVGPQGLGGTVTALSCAIAPYPTHIASLPCALSIGCHVTRRAEGTL